MSDDSLMFRGHLFSALAVFGVLYIKTIEKFGGIEGYLDSKKVLITDNHFVYTKGGHGSTYVNVKGLRDVFSLAPVAMHMAYIIHRSNFAPQVIIGVLHGADTLATLVTFFYALFSGETSLNLKIMKHGREGFAWYKDHAEFAKDKKVLLVEDVVNTGGSLSECGEFVLNSGCSGLGFSVVADRISDQNPGLSTLAQKVGADYSEALVTLQAENFIIPEGANPSDHCPYCQEGRKINQQIGHGKRFLEEIRNTFSELYDRLK